MPRWLQSFERQVPPDRSELYERLWRRVLRQAEIAGLHAWRFRAAGREDCFLEFLEGAEAADLDDPAIVATLRQIREGVGTAEGRTWEEVTGDER